MYLVPYELPATIAFDYQFFPYLEIVRNRCEPRSKSLFCGITTDNTNDMLASKTKERNAVVSAKVPKKLKQELEKAGVNVSEAIRRGLENALKEKKVQYLEGLLQGVDLGKLTDEQIVRDIRSGRERKPISQGQRVPKRLRQ